jgi:hypothetical protein
MDIDRPRRRVVDYARNRNAWGTEVIDRVLDEEIKEISALIERWGAFSRLVLRAREGAAGEEETRRFGELRREVSMFIPPSIQNYRTWRKKLSVKKLKHTRKNTEPPMQPC